MTFPSQKKKKKKKKEKEKKHDIQVPWNEYQINIRENITSNRLCWNCILSILITVNITLLRLGKTRQCASINIALSLKGWMDEAHHVKLAPEQRN